MTRKKMAMMLVPALLLAQVSGGGAARADLVSNGNFTSTTGANGNNAGVGQINYNIGANGWTVPGAGYGFVMNGATASTTGAPSEYGSTKTFSLWGPGNGVSNGLTASPAGGNFIAGDGDTSLGGGSNQFSIQQVITGLTAGTSYAVSFYWGGAEQYGFNSPTNLTAEWTVGFGSAAKQTTTAVSYPSEGFSGWKLQTFVFTADSTSDTLSFLATGSPNGVPPFALLDGVTVNAVPEPSSMLMFGVGLLGFGALELRRRAKAAKA